MNTTDTAPCGQHTAWEPQCGTCRRLEDLEARVSLAKRWGSAWKSEARFTTSLARDAVQELERQSRVPECMSCRFVGIKEEVRTHVHNECKSHPLRKAEAERNEAQARAAHLETKLAFQAAEIARLSERVVRLERQRDDLQGRNTELVEQRRMMESERDARAASTAKEGREP